MHHHQTALIAKVIINIDKKIIMHVFMQDVVGYVRKYPVFFPRRSVGHLLNYQMRSIPLVYLLVPHFLNPPCPS